jgi:YidC/Oxa1 family membrane protein insertase
VVNGESKFVGPANLSVSAPVLSIIFLNSDVFQSGYAALWWPATCSHCGSCFQRRRSGAAPSSYETAAAAEIKSLGTKVGGWEEKPAPGFWARLFTGSQQDPKSVDEYSHWARLRAGLLYQYVLNKPDEALKLYTKIGMRYAMDRVHAQAIYQKGDLLWHTSKPGQPRRHEASSTLEQMVHQGRGASQFEDFQIIVPKAAPGQDATTLVTKPGGFQTVTVGEWRSAPGKPNPEGLPDRVDVNYSTTPFHTFFSEVVRLFGNKPAYSYGIAILFFAMGLRLLLQPLNKKQYASMKGMQELAPEMKKIQDKYKQDKYKDKPEMQMQMMKEVRELQRERGVNPMSTIGWGLIQIPIFIFVVAPLIQHFEARMELAGASFLWVDSLARPDVPLLVAYAISQFLSFRLSATPPTDAQQAQMQTILAFVMPVTIPFFLRTYPSAFVLFWMAFNVISTFFQYRMMKATDPNRSVMKALMQPLKAPATPADETIPARPGSKPDGKDAATAKNSVGEAGSNGTRNGKSRSKAKVLTTISPSELNGSAEEFAAGSGNGTANQVAKRNKNRRRRRR